MISINWTLIIQIINFLVLMIVLNKLLFQPILQVIDERREQTEAKEARARETDRAADEKAKDYAEKIKQAKIEASSKKHEFREAGQKEEEKILSAARAEGEAALAKIQEGIAQEAAAARQQLNEQAQMISEMIFTKLLGRSPS